MPNYVRTSIVLLISVLACSLQTPQIGDSQPTAASDQIAPPTIAPLPPPTPDVELPDNLTLPAVGTLAIVGLDGNIYQANQADGLIPLTTDAASVQNRLTVFYGNPAWSSDGWLSIVKVDATAASPTLSLLAYHPELPGPRRLFQTTTSNYIYGYWSPQSPCASGTACGRIAYLMSGSSTIELHLASVSTNPDMEPDDEILDHANPFYYSWSPDGQNILWHQNGETLAIFDTASQTLNELSDVAGNFQAPGWSPTDDRLLFAAVDNSQSVISIKDGDGTTTIGQATDATSYFLWSPDGTKIAHASGSYPLTHLTIEDLDLNQSMEISGFEEVISFFWSPDSRRLAVVTVEPYIEPLPEAAVSTQRGKTARQEDNPSIVLAWWLVDVESSDTRRLTQFIATADQFYLFQYFDQYAQSHRVWSPDSRYITYAYLPINGGDPEVAILDAAEPQATPQFIMHGLQAIFSFNE